MHQETTEIDLFKPYSCRSVTVTRKEDAIQTTTKPIETNNKPCGGTPSENSNERASLFESHDVSKRMPVSLTTNDGNQFYEESRSPIWYSNKGEWTSVGSTRFNDYWEWC